MAGVGIGKEQPPGLPVTAQNTGYGRFIERVEAVKSGIGKGISDGTSWVSESSFVDRILRRKHIQASDDGRHIPLMTEIETPLIDNRHGVTYVSNSIRTSRYTIWDFIPKQLFFQFSRVGNFYFLCVGIPQMVSLNCATAATLLFLTQSQSRFRDYQLRVLLQQFYPYYSLSS